MARTLSIRFREILGMAEKGLENYVDKHKADNVLPFMKETVETLDDLRSKIRNHYERIIENEDDHDKLVRELLEMQARLRQQVDPLLIGPELEAAAPEAGE